MFKNDVMKSVMKAFGQGVPDRVTEALMFHDVNTQFQLDQPFILSMTPGEIAQYLNEVMNLSIIDGTIENINRMGRKCSSDIKVCSSSISSMTEELKKLEWVDGAVDDCKKLEVLCEKSELLANKITSAESALSEYAAAKSFNVSAYKKSLSIEKLISDAEASVSEYKETKDIIDEICDCTDDLKEKTSDIKAANDVLLKIENQLSEFKVCEACGSVLG